MKKLIAFLALAGVLNFGASSLAFAQDEADTVATDTAMTEQVDTTAAEADTAAAAAGETDLKETEKEKQTFHQVLKEK